MSLKTKLYDRALVKADIKRFWIAGLFYALVVFFLSVFQLFTVIKADYIGASDRFLSQSIGSFFMGVVFGGIIAIALFSYLNSPSATAFYHGLPLSRKTIFISKIFSAFLLLTVPVLLNALAAGIMLIAKGTALISAKELTTWIITQLVYSYIAFSCVTLTAMVAGNIITHIIITGICIILPALVFMFSEALCTRELFGYIGSFADVLRYIYIFPTEQMFSYGWIIYLIASAVFVLIAYFIYKIRPLECCGESSVFPATKVIFIYFVAVIGGILGYWYFEALASDNILYMLPFGIAGIIGANMINRRSVTLKGAFLHAGIYVICVLAILTGFKTDIFGYEKRVPKEADISSATFFVDHKYSSVPMFTDEGKQLIQKNTPDFTIYNSEDIKKITAFHRYVSTAKEQISHGKYVELEYKLKNGGKLKRGYTIDPKAVKEYLEPVYEIDQVKKAYFPLYKREDVKIKSFEISAGTRNYENTIMISKGNEYFDELKAAIEYDIEHLAYDENPMNHLNKSLYPAFIDITYSQDYVDEKGNDAKSEIYSVSEEYTITKGFIKTMEVLKKAGFKEIEFNEENIHKAAIDRDSDYKGGLIFEGRNVDEIITDKAQIRKKIDECMSDTDYINHADMQIADTIIFQYKNGEIVEVYSWK